MSAHPSAITDDDWRRLCAAAKGLAVVSDDMRPAIESIVRLYRQFKAADDRPASDVRMALRSVERVARKLIQQIADLGPQERNALASTIPHPLTEGAPPMLASARFLSDLETRIRELATQSESASNRLPRTRPGSDSGNRDWAIVQIDRVLIEHAGVGLKSGTGAHDEARRALTPSLHFLRTFFRIAENNPRANPTGLPGSIRRAIRSRSTPESN